MHSHVLGFQDIDQTMLMAAGGKGANLGALSRIEGINVPDGFCVTTEAYRRILGEAPQVYKLLDRLSLLKADDRTGIAELSGEIRRVIEATQIPEDIREEIAHHLARLGDADTYAVRSSATAEDLPTASFAGQQDTYLNIIGQDSILKHIGKCWASLFTERAVLYRLQNGFGHRDVQLAVVVQKMVFPQVSGILFTADPVTSNRKTVSIEAGFGLGEAMVSGLVSADIYLVRNGTIVGRQIASKKRTVVAIKSGGTREAEIEPARQNRPTLTDGQILRLEQLGRKIEAHFGRPQDIEWCLADGAFQIVQSRPITALFPIPEANAPGNHVYVSVGHQQMMTDAMKPLGLSFFLLTTRAPMRTAAGRLFVDVTPMLSSPDTRQMVIDNFGQHDPLMKDAIETIVARGDIIKPAPGEEKMGSADQKPGSAEQQPVPGEERKPGSGRGNQVISTTDARNRIGNDPAIVAGLIGQWQASIEALRHDIQSKSGPELFDFILEDIQELKKILFDPQSMGVILAAMDAAFWINQHMALWLGEINAADTLAQSVPNNVTSEMGLALLDVADAIRPYPDVIDYMQQVPDERFLEDLVNHEGGREARDAIQAFLDKYGMRCIGEIDITRTRWSERPAILVPAILGNIRNFEPGAGKRKYEQGLRAALAKEHDLLDRLRQLPDGRQKAAETVRMIRLVRNYSGFREFPKYVMVNRYFIYKQALLKEAERLVQAQVIREREDVYYLSFEEFREAVRTGHVDDQVIGDRKREFKSFEKLSPPRVITSDGEAVSGAYKRESVPADALAGLAVSSGIVEGRARIILDMADAVLEPGDILVTAFTDPSWTPLFVSIIGLVTEVGGLMTHGAVIAREYGLPAVVGVANATRLIRDGQQIRVNGAEGYVEII